MVEVNLWSGLRRFTDGATVVTVEAETIGQLLDALAETWPGLGPVIEAGVSVSIDGEIISGNRHRTVPPGAEVFLLRRIKGG